MDAIVRQAMAKWPNVPHCYGWLALDARGHWRMRDQQAHAQAWPGDRISHAPLLDFINRNYTCDERGCWYFQNGPQRVYVDLEAAPYVVRTDPQQGLLLHTGAPLLGADAVPQWWLSEQGRLFVHGAGKLAVLDDRDAAECLADLRIDGRAADDTALEHWLASGAGRLTLRFRQHESAVAHAIEADLPARFAFVRTPRA